MIGDDCPSPRSAFWNPSESAEGPESPRSLPDSAAIARLGPNHGDFNYIWLGWLA